MSNNKEVKVTIDVGAKFKGREQINESVQAVQALANVTGLTGKQISKMHKGLMSLEDAHKILAHLNNTMGLSSTQIKLFAQAIGKSDAEVQDFLNKNSNLTEEYERQCKRVERLENWTTNLSTKHKEQEKSLASLRKEYTKLGGDAEHAAEEIAKYKSTLFDMKYYQDTKKSKLVEKGYIETQLQGTQKLKDYEEIIKQINEKKKERDTNVNEITRVRNGEDIPELRRVKDDIKAYNSAKRDYTKQLKATPEEDINSIIGLQNAIAELDEELEDLKSDKDDLEWIQKDEYIANTTKEVDRLNTEIDELNAKLKELSTGEIDKLAQLSAEINRADTEYNRLSATLPENYNELIKTGDKIESLSEKHKNNEEYIKQWDEKLKESTGVINEQGQAVSTAGSLIGEYAKEAHNNIVAQTELKESTDNVKNSVEELKGTEDNFGNTISNTKHNVEGFNEIVAKTGDYVSSSYPVLINSLNGVPQAFSNASISAQSLQSNLNSLDDEEYKVIDSTFEVTGTIGKLDDMVNQVSWSLPELDESLEDSSEHVSDMDNAVNKSSEHIEQLERSLDELSESTKESSESTEESSESSSKLDKSTSNLGNSMLEAAIKYKLLTKALDIGKKLYQEYTKTLEDVGRVAINTGESLVNGFGQAIETAEKLIDIADKACNKIKELADAGSDLQAGWFKLYNYLGEEGGNTYLDYLNDLHDVLSVDADDIVQNAEGVLSMVDNLGLSLEKSTEAMEAFTHFGLDLSTFSGESFGEIVGQLENAVNLNVLNSRSALAHALNLTDKDIEVFKSFNSEQERANYLLSRGGEFRNNYKKWLQTAGGKIAQLNSSVSSLTGNIQKLSTGLLAKLAPVITSIIKLLDRLVSMLYKVFNIKDLTSAEGNMAKGFDGVVGDAESATEALDDTTEAAKKLERQAAGFDDVIQINDSSSSSKDIKDKVNGLMGDIDFSNWFEDLTPNPSAFEKKLDKIYDMIGKGKWAEVGNKVRDLIVNGLNSIDWDEIKSKLTGFMSGISNLLNGLLEDGELTVSIGASLSQLINTVVAGINAFLGNRELFKNLGISLAKGLSSFFVALDAKGIANMLSSFVHDVFTTFSNFVDTMNKDGTWSLIGTKISAIINGFFSSFTIEDVQNGVDSIISFINGVFEMIGTFMDNLDTEDIKNKITTFVRGLFEGFKEHQDEWAATLSEFTGFIMDLLSSLIRTWDKTGMTNAVIEFIADSGIGDLVWKLTKTKFKIGWEKFKIEFISALEAFFGDILYKIGNIIGLIIATVIEFLDTIGADIMYALGNIIGYITVAISGLIGAILGLGTRLKEGLSEVWDWVKDLFSNIFDWVGDWVSKLWDKVSGFFESLKDKILGVDETVSSAESHSSGGGSHSGGGYYRNGNGFISSYSDEGIEVPLLANGGIVHRATLATIGEAGTEAVVPLQNNTEWMDTMAKSLVSAMDNKNNGMTGSTVVIDMSKCSKQVYTRSELQAFGKLIADSLNTYGANVAYNY